MIIDNLENISMYRIIPDHVIKFIKSLKVDTNTGKVQLLDNDYANIEIYNTKIIEDAKFEAHNNYIDIQILLEGRERIYYTSVDKLDIDIPYDSDKDIKFFKNSVNNNDFITLNGRNFVMIFPHEAHAPQVADSNIQEVKKVVVKVKL